MMAMGFQNGSRLRQLFELPTPHTTPGIGAGPPGVTSPNDLSIAPPMEAANRSPARMAFRGAGGGGIGVQPQSAPISTLSLDTPLAPTGLQAQPVAPMDSLQPKKKGFFDRGGAWRDVLGALADGMAGAAGGQPVYGPMKMRQRQQQAEWERQDALRREDRSWAEQDRDKKLAQPQYFMSGRDRVMFDPVTGESQTVYDGPTDFQEYADLFDLEPGTDEYREAMQDFVLRSNGPTAQAGRIELEGARHQNRVGLEGIRQSNRATLRQMPTYANLHPRQAAGGSGGGNRPPRNTGNVYAPILAKMATGQTLTLAEQQVLSYYGRGVPGARKSGGASASPVAVDAKGNKVRWDGKSWAPVR